MKLATSPLVIIGETLDAKFTVPVNPLMLATPIVKLAEDPVWISDAEGVGVIPKPATAAEMVVFWNREPEAAVIVAA